jgi:hypothetical protein
MTSLANISAPLESFPPSLPSDALQRALAPDVAERLSFLFRASLKEGRIHPLYLPMLRYRHAQAGT